MAVVLAVDEMAAVPEHPDQRSVGLLHPLACNFRDVVIERAVRPDGAQQGNFGRIHVAIGGLLVHLVVHLAEGGRLVHEARAAVERDEVAGEHLPQVGFPSSAAQCAVLVPVSLFEMFEGWVIAQAQQSVAAQSFLYWQRVPQLFLESLAQSRCQDQRPVARPHFHVLVVRPDRDVLVGRQCPRCGRPDQQRRGWIVRERKRHVHGRILDRLVPEAHLAGGECRAALGPPPDDLVAAVEQSLLIEPAQRPPYALDIGLVVRHVGVGEVNPEAHPAGHLLPLLGVPEHRVHALADEAFDAVVLDGLLAVDAEFLFDFYLYREPVRVPSRLARNVSARHGPVAQEDVLEHAREHVAVVRQPVCSGGTLVEDEALGSLAELQALVEDLLLVPELADLALTCAEIDNRLGALESGLAHGGLGLPYFLVSRTVAARPDWPRPEYLADDPAGPIGVGDGATNVAGLGRGARPGRRSAASTTRWRNAGWPKWHANS